ncbi:tyrosine-type recombinase/integrase [Flavobacterium kingsejongi]|uniref:Tyr recombinase domain-containing protein n=1 Tax=Flavobacterium kingsejongi TaxID=1678728 RepID=A0A2S1LU15_9FLAO|nr:site-specific integrase [Flavobacterium kingsejongi]AWG27198.1 hypothetical protein FK004_19235 [Flavobacterium kingsejongi]
MKNLLNGCSYSDIWVSPEDWKKTTAKSSLKKPWYIQCYFFDPNFKKKFPRGFPYRKKLNSFKTLDERKAAAELYLKEIPKLFEDMGYNPIRDIYMINKSAEVALFDLGPDSLFCNALELAFNKIKIADSTRNDIRQILVHLKKAAIRLGYDLIRVEDIKRRNIKLLFDDMENKDKFSAHKFNKYRGYLSIIYTCLLEYEAVESNIIKDISKRKQTKNIREVLTDSQRKKVNDHLRNNYPEFWRFTLIFFHSGGRVRELLDVKIKDVDLKNQTYRVLIKKGSSYEWVVRVIKDISVDLWKRVMLSGINEDYVFSVGLVPGPQRIRREQIGRRWNVHVKEKLNITADFYSLKHLNLDETTEMLSMNDAAAMANHKSTKMIENHYAVGEKARQNERLKSIRNEFA